MSAWLLRWATVGDALYIEGEMLKTGQPHYVCHVLVRRSRFHYRRICTERLRAWDWCRVVVRTRERTEGFFYVLALPKHHSPVACYRVVGRS